MLSTRRTFSAIAAAFALFAPAMVLAAPSATAETKTEEFKLIQLVFARQLQGRTPAEVSPRIAADGARVYAHAQFANTGDPRTVTMSWQRDGRVRHRFSLKVGRSPSWRTWSYLNAVPHNRGTWTVTLHDEDVLLGSAELSIGDAP